jgi:hypothetical protein
LRGIQPECLASGKRRNSDRDDPIRPEIDAVIATLADRADGWHLSAAKLAG